jgi:hypothetical protein
MRISKLLLICMCCLVAAPAVWGQAASSQAHTGILGYLDPRTGAFRPIPPAAEDSPDALALTTFTGTINLTITITVKSVGLTTFICSAEVSVGDNVATASPRFFGESNTVAATGTGATRSCKLSIPYSWGLSTGASDSMSTSYVVSGAATSAGAPPNRASTLTPVDTRKVPSSGTTTALTAAVTL